MQDQHALVLDHLEDVAHVCTHGLADARARDALLAALVLQLPGHDAKGLLVVGAHPGVVELLPLVLVDLCLADGQDLHAGESHLQEGLHKLLPLTEQVSGALLQAFRAELPTAPGLWDLH